MRIAIVEGRFYEALSDALLEGAKDSLESLGIPLTSRDIFTVPGALELPPLIRAIDRAQPGKYAGFVALGIVIRGETSHYDVVVDQTSRKLMDLSTDSGLCMGVGLVTVENESQAWARVRKEEINVGGRAVQACYSLIIHQQKLGLIS